MLGHSATHAPLCKKGADALVQDMQSVAAGPEHVPQLEWHGSQTPLELAYAACGVQSERQLLAAGSKKG